MNFVFDFIIRGTILTFIFSLNYFSLTQAQLVCVKEFHEIELNRMQLSCMRDKLACFEGTVLKEMQRISLHLFIFFKTCDKCPFLHIWNKANFFEKWHCFFISEERIYLK